MVRGRDGAAGHRPLEAGLNGTPKLDQIRSISIFGLSDVKLYFDFNSSYFIDRQEALNRLESLTLPNNLQPQLSPESPVGEIYRYQLIGPSYCLNELKASRTGSSFGKSSTYRESSTSRPSAEPRANTRPRSIPTICSPWASP